jgi:A/G-specific adenine glycosylase
MKLVPQKGEIQKNLLHWFKRNARDLPWRRTRSPYAIWVSEIMLQQTQVPTVIPYYKRFLKTFPAIRRLAEADLSEVLMVWEGLGYYSRARNLHKASQEVLSRFKGKLPYTLDDLLSLPGIGRYTAGAILSIAFNKEAPILDGNVKRVLSRLFAISNSPGRDKAEGLLWNFSETLIPKGHAGSFNQALMDLGSMICTPRDPQCIHCPLSRLCKAKTEGNPEKYPAREAKKRIPHIHAAGAVIQKNGEVLLTQRPPKGLLGGLWEFPNWKIECREGLQEQLKRWIKSELGIRVKSIKPLGSFNQTFSHFKLTLHVNLCHIHGEKNYGTWVPVRDLHLFPMSRLHRIIARTIGEKFQEMR